MKYLVVLVAACLASPALGAYGGNYGGYGGYSGPQASPVVTPNGFLADTPEVAAAKAAHYSEVARAQTNPAYSAYDDGSYKQSYNAPSSYAAPAQASYAAPAQTSYAAPSYGAPAYASGSHYNGPYAKPVVTPNGFLADTPEVAAAKAAHFSEVAKVQSAPSYTPGNAYDDGSYRPAAYASAPAAYSGAPAYNGAPAYSGASASYGNQGYYGAPAAPTGGYTGPLAKPVITPNGFLADTPEVAAAKAAHFSEVAKSQSQYSYGGHGQRYRRSLVLAQTPASTVPLAYAATHVAPVIAAAPVAHIAYAAPVAHVAYPTLAVHRPAFAYAVHH